MKFVPISHLDTYLGQRYASFGESIQKAAHAHDGRDQKIVVGLEQLAGAIVALPYSSGENVLASRDHTHPAIADFIVEDLGVNRQHLWGESSLIMHALFRGFGDYDDDTGKYTIFLSSYETGQIYSDVNLCLGISDGRNKVADALLKLEVDFEGVKIMSNFL